MTKRNLQVGDVIKFTEACYGSRCHTDSNINCCHPDTFCFLSRDNEYVIISVTPLCDVLIVTTQRIHTNKDYDEDGQIIVFCTNNCEKWVNEWTNKVVGAKEIWRHDIEIVGKMKEKKQPSYFHKEVK